MRGKLYIVATPIGNLKDITFRAIEVLRYVDIIICENPLHSLKLLNEYEIKKNLQPFHKFNEKASINKIINWLEEGKNIALISDAGTPLISDPGYILISTLRDEGFEVTPVPGACAGINALIASGLNTEKFCFVGFLHGNKSKKTEELNKYKELECTLIFYLAPHNLNEDLMIIANCLGKRKAVLCNELTKIHEKYFEFDLSNIPTIEPRGEYVLVVEGCNNKIDYANISIEEHLQKYVEMGIDEKAALKMVAKDRGVSKSIIYKSIIDKKHKK